MKNLLSMKKYFVKSSLFSDFFSKNFAFTIFLPKMRESKFLKFPHWGKVTLTLFIQKFRESNAFTKEMAK